jgi:hypothetical protein
MILDLRLTICRPDGAPIVIRKTKILRAKNKPPAIPGKIRHCGRHWSKS